MASLIVVMGLALVNVHAETSSDTPSSWAYERIQDAVDLGIVPANLQSNFTQAITRAEFTELAVTLYENVTGVEIIGRTSFNDTTDINVEKIAYLGVVSGVGDNRFDPYSPLTREQAATILVRLFFAIHANLDTDLPAMLDLPHLSDIFTDYEQVSPWAFDGVASAYALNIMSGVGNNRFDPGGLYTREQSIVTIMRIHEMFPDEITAPTFVTIYIPDAMFATALEFIYEDSNNRYYLPAIMSNSIMLTFLDGTEITLREALDQQKIIIADLILSGLDLIIMPID